MFKAIKKKKIPLETSNLHCLGGYMGNKFIVGDMVWRKGLTYDNINKQKQVGKVSDVRLIPGGKFVYDIKFTPGFGPRTANDIPEIDVIEFIEKKKRSAEEGITLVWIYISRYV